MVLVEVLPLILLPSAEDIILDKDTAHLYLAVSPDGKVCEIRDQKAGRARQT